MKSEATFMVFDGLMLLIACSLLSIFHPAIFFPYMCSSMPDKAETEGLELSSISDSERGLRFAK